MVGNAKPTIPSNGEFLKIYFLYSMAILHFFFKHYFKKKKNSNDSVNFNLIELSLNN